MKQEILDALRGTEESFPNSDFRFQETGTSSAGVADSSPGGGAKDEMRAVEDAGTGACHPERSEAESKDLGALSVRDEDEDLIWLAATFPVRGEGREARAVEGVSPSVCGANIRAHWERLRAEAAEIPGFDLDRAMRDAAFVRLTAPGVGVPVRDAWYALHREESERQSVEKNRAMLARAAAAFARRPREGGGSGAALIASDYRSLPRQEQLRVKQHIIEAAARGEKVYP